MKIKYTWTHMHGDADHYDDKELILTEAAEIALFDYITTELEFRKREQEGFVVTMDHMPKLVSLINDVERLHKIKYDYDWEISPSFEDFIQTSECDNNLAEEEYIEAILHDGLNELISDWKYVVNDVTCDGYHYAAIQNFKREDITNVVTNDELLQFIIDKYKLNKNELEQEYLKRGK